MKRRSGSPNGATDGQRTLSSWCRMGFMITSARESGSVEQRAGKIGSSSLPPIGPSILSSQPKLIRCSGENFLQDGTATFLYFPADPKGIAGRDASGKVLNVLAQSIPWFLGGSADLGPSNKTILTYEGAGSFQAGNPGGKNLHFGIREHAMAATVNGLSLSKLRAFGATFFIFSDYARPAIRLSALMELPTIFVFTHDAMGDGEDGPTHQPVEQLASLRAIPGLVTLRPGDANEVVEAYRTILQLRHEPAVLALSRQPLPTLDRSKYAAASGVARGAYVLGDAPGGNPEVILIASGSEVSLAVEAHEQLLAEGIRSRVVSMPSWDLFDHQSQEYRDSCPAPLSDGAGRGRTGVDLRMGALRRHDRPDHRHEDVRRFGAAEGIAEAFRLRARPSGCCCKGCPRKEVAWRIAITRVDGALFFNHSGAG